MLFKLLFGLVCIYTVFIGVNGDPIKCGGESDKIQTLQEFGNNYDIFTIDEEYYPYNVYISTCNSETKTVVTITAYDEKNISTFVERDMLSCDHNEKAVIDMAESIQGIKWIEVRRNEDDKKKKHQSKYHIKIYCNITNDNEIDTCGIGAGLNSVSMSKEYSGDYSPIDFNNPLIIGVLAVTHVIVGIFIFIGLIVYYWDILNDVEYIEKKWK